MNEQSLLEYSSNIGIEIPIKDSNTGEILTLPEIKQNNGMSISSEATNQSSRISLRRQSKVWQQAHTTMEGQIAILGDLGNDDDL